MCSFIERSLSRKKPRFLTESEKELVVWQIEGGAGGCLSLEELKSIVFVLSAFRWGLFSVIQSFISKLTVEQLTLE